MSGSVGYHSGVSAEDAVARLYIERGFCIAAQRFRSKSGEIDLIAQRGDNLVFIEVKKSKSHAAAAARLSARQMTRIYATAADYLATQPGGQETPCQFDVGLVDAVGRVEILENAFSG